MLNQAILEYATEKGFHKKTLERWQQLSGADQQALLVLTQTLKLGENHFRDFLDWLEEISLRDHLSAAELLEGEVFLRLLSDPRLGRSDKLKAVKEELRRLRFPRLSRIERELQEKVRSLKLPPQIQMSIPPGLEGGTLTIQIKAAAYDELSRLVEQLQAVLERDCVKGMFVLLSGKEEDAGFPT